MQLNLIFLGQILVAGKKFVKCLKIKKYYIKKKNIFYRPWGNIQIYLVEKIF